MQEQTQQTSQTQSDQTQQQQSTAQDTSQQDRSGDGGSRQDSDPVAMAKRLGELEAMEKEFQTYRKQVDPILETVYTDPELLAKTTASYNKRLGITVNQEQKDDQQTTQTQQDKAPEVRDLDTRNAVVNQVHDSFEKKNGIDKLSGEDQAKVRGLVGSMLKEMLDPKGNKTIAQIYEEVSLTKLPWYLDKAYYLINRDNDLKSAREQGKNEVLNQYEEGRGSIGSVVGSTQSAETIELSPKERKIAQNMGISEKDYLDQKKQIASLRNS